MKITLWPKTVLGKWSALFSFVFVILIALKIGPGLPLPTFSIAGLGMVGFGIGIIAIIKKDRSIGNFLSILLGIAIIFIFVQVWISSAGLFKDFPLKDSLTAPEEGDGNYEIMNLGSISQKDGWIYYVYEENLYKRKSDWTDKTKVSESQVAEIYILGDWIYYKSNQDNGNLFKMRVDGSGQAKISDDLIDSFAVSGEWIFYNIFKDSKVKMSSDSIYKIRTDGTSKMKLTDIRWSENLKIQGDWLYYNYIEDTSEGMIPHVYRIKTDGTEKNLVVKGSGFNYILGDWVYYLVSSDEGKGLEKITICRIKGDGTEKFEILTLSGIYGLAFDDGWFYYTSGKEMSRMKLDGTGTEKLNDIEIWALDGVSGNWMYISDYGGPRFRVKIDGSVGTRLN